MHELNVLMEVVDQVETMATEQKIEKVAAIVLEIGELSSVVPHFMEEYYPLIVENKECLKDSKLVIERIPGEARCTNCDEIYNVVQNDGFCPLCGRFEKEVLQGREFMIKEIWV
ncbi:MAG: hydrogenase maturation nickel metallochaperone HypA [Desulfobacterales bacterium]|jgi:hydrogenase nickel incorporation protein HypA/HybF|nr:hydrogenase maturation nickel metallochaperone HypA [Desulfobacterales bacterium]